MPDKLNIFDIKIGDKVAIKKAIPIGWSSTYRNKLYKIETVTKITPKKTKITTDKSEYETKNTNFYDPTDESVWRENTLALYFKESEEIIESLNKAKTDQIPDEKLFEFLSLLEKAFAIVSKNNE